MAGFKLKLEGVKELQKALQDLQKNFRKLKGEHASKEDLAAKLRKIGLDRRSAEKVAGEWWSDSEKQAQDEPNPDEDQEEK